MNNAFQRFAEASKIGPWPRFMIRMAAQAPLQLRRRYGTPINGRPVGDHDIIIDSNGVEWFFDQTGHLDTVGSDWPADELSGYMCASFDEAVQQLIDDGYLELAD